mmetsp:Transcript_6623/g.9842  ORF Transcript_6623/g.9842 Transcript_6623/m.9842 type:complete len:553 (-) Transcript_6623:1540-3198(-)
MTVTNEEGGANLSTGMIYFIKAFVGPGCLSLPLAFQNCGLGLGIGLLLSMGVMVTYNLRTMVLCKQHLNYKGVQTYADLTQEALGTGARRIVEMFINGVQLGICAVYFDFFAEGARVFLPKRLQTRDALYLLMVAIFPIYVALALLKSIKTIAPYAALANALIYGSIGVVIFVAFTEIHRVYQNPGDAQVQAQLSWFDIKKVPTFYSTVVYSFEGVCSLLPVENALANPRVDMPTVTYVGMFIVTLTYTGVGAIAYAAWPTVRSGSITAEVSSRATGTFWRTVSLTSNVATIIAVILTFPVQLFPSIELLEKTCHIQRPPSTISSRRRRQSVSIDDHQYHPTLIEEQGIELADLEDTHRRASKDYSEPKFVIIGDDDDDTTDEDTLDATRTHHADAFTHAHIQNGHTNLDEEKSPTKNPLRATTGEESEFDGASIFSDDDIDPQPWRRIFFRITVVFFVGLAAALVPDLGELIALIGALTGSALSLVFPALIDIKCPRPNRRKWELVVDIFVIVIGIIGGTTGTIQALQNAFSSHDDDTIAANGADNTAARF